MKKIAIISFWQDFLPATKIFWTKNRSANYRRMCSSRKKLG